jgi:hypothetical protein
LRSRDDHAVFAPQQVFEHYFDRKRHPRQVKARFSQRFERMDTVLIAANRKCSARAETVVAHNPIIQESRIIGTGRRAGEASGGRRDEGSSSCRRSGYRFLEPAKRSAAIKH